MQYRRLGKTELKVSEISLGCEGFIGKDQAFTDEMIGYAIENGVNCIDLYTPDPDMHARIGKAIKPYRDRVLLQAHLCSVQKDGSYFVSRELATVRQSFCEMLHNLQTDSVEILLIHYIDSKNTWETVVGNGILDYALQLKREGKVKAVGISSHSSVATLAAVQSGKLDLVLFSVNPCYDLIPSQTNGSAETFTFEPNRLALYNECKNRDVSIAVMKVFCGGALLRDDSPLHKKLTVSQCIQYALDRPSALTVMAGSQSLAQLQDAIGYLTADAAERDYASVFASLHGVDWQGYCIYCGHCEPCPQGIRIAATLRYTNIARSQGFLPETIREHYKALPVGADQCLFCGKCEQKCPFGVKIMQTMQTAIRIFNEVKK